MLPLGEHSPANCVMLGQSPIVSEVWSALRDQSCVDLHAMVQFITANNKSRDLEGLLKAADQRAPALGRISHTSFRRKGSTHLHESETKRVKSWEKTCNVPSRTNSMP
jgi:hypothetical protein